MSDGKKLFVGVRVSLQTANALARCAETLARRARDANVDVQWVAPANYHLTLKYLGWTHDDAVGAVTDACDAALAGATAFKFRTAKVGAFATIEKANVVWAGIDDPKPLTELATRVEGAMVALGFAPETRAFHPHVTLGRLKESRPLRDVVLPVSEQMFSDTPVDGVTMFESETKSSGSVYKEISRINFKTAIPQEKRQTGALDLGEETDDGWPRGQGQ